MGLVTSRVDRSDVNDLFFGRVSKSAPRKAEQTNDDQNDPEYLIHRAPL